MEKGNDEEVAVGIALPIMAEDGGVGKSDLHMSPFWANGVGETGLHVINVWLTFCYRNNF